jgi:hypothetical protein
LFCATITSVWAAIHLNMNPAYVGMAMTYTLLVPIYLNWVVRNLASLEMYMNSVERVREFSHLETEDQSLDSILDSETKNFFKTFFKTQNLSNNVNK